MNFKKWFGYFSAILLVIGCFMPWISIASKDIMISGVDATGTNFGKPAYAHFIFTVLFVIFHSTPRLWANRWNLLIVALNSAWAIKNYFIISACFMGDCPHKELGLFLVLIATVFMFISALFPAKTINENKK